MRLLNKYPAVGRSVGAKVPAKTLNYYPLMSKLAAPETVRRIETPQGPETVVDMNPSQPPETAYKAPTKFTGNIDSDINNEMARLRAEDAQRVQKLQQQLPEMRKLEENKHLAADHVFKGIYDSPDGDAFLRRRATQNVFDANPNMDYDDLTGNMAEQYDNTNQGSQDKGTQALADRMKFIQKTGPEEFGYTSPSTWGIPRFARNLFNPSEWSTKDFATADSALDKGVMAASFFNPALAPLMAATKGVGKMYGKYQNNMYNGRNGFEWGNLGMDALRTGANTTLSSFGVDANKGIGAVFSPINKHVTTPFMRGVGNYLARPIVNRMGGSADYLYRNSQGAYTPLYDTAVDWISHGGKSLGTGITNYLAQRAPTGRLGNLAGSALAAGEQFLSNNLGNFVETAGLEQGVDYAKEKTLGANTRNPALPANQQFAQNMPRPVNTPPVQNQPKPVSTQPVNNMPRFGGQQQANNMPKPVNQPQFNRARG